MTHQLIRRSNYSSFSRLLVLVVAIVFAAACRATPAPPPPPPAEDWPTATIKDLMLEIVDPSSEALWESVAEIVTLSGTERHEPVFDEEWALLRGHAIRLLEVPNLLTMRGRLVAPPNHVPENPGIELKPEEIAVLIEKDRAKWAQLAKELHDSVVPMLAAIDAKSSQGLMDAGERVYHACETCHQQYWYPNSPAPKPVPIP